MFKFSVLISVYFKDNPDFLDAALHSLTIQTVKADEVVLVVDGDVSEEIWLVINKYNTLLDLNILKLKINLGLGNALYEGIKVCKHKFVARMDSDDICMPNRFEIQINYLKINQDVDVLGGYCLEFDDDRPEFSVIKKVPINNLEIFKLSKYRNPVNHVTVFINKDSVIKSGSYNSEHPLMEDYSLWVRMIKNKYIFHNIPTPLVKVRVGLDMINRRRGFKYLKYDIKFQKYLLNINHIKLSHFIVNLSLRFSLRLAPEKFLKIFYFTLLRSKNNL